MKKLLTNVAVDDKINKSPRERGDERERNEKARSSGEQESQRSSSKRTS